MVCAHPRGHAADLIWPAEALRLAGFGVRTHSRSNTGAIPRRSAAAAALVAVVGVRHAIVLAIVHGVLAAAAITLAAGSCRCWAPHAPKRTGAAPRSAALSRGRIWPAARRLVTETLALCRQVIGWFVAGMIVAALVTAAAAGGGDLGLARRRGGPVAYLLAAIVEAPISVCQGEKTRVDVHAWCASSGHLHPRLVILRGDRDHVAGAPVPPADRPPASDNSDRQ